MSLVYEETCEVICTDNDKMVIAEVLNFRINQELSVSINRSIKVNMRYNPKHKIYIGSAAGLEFTSDGPITREVKRFKR